MCSSTKEVPDPVLAVALGDTVVQLLQHSPVGHLVKHIREVKAYCVCFGLYYTDFIHLCSQIIKGLNQLGLAGSSLMESL